jgi:hypothetical protein
MKKGIILGVVFMLFLTSCGRKKDKAGSEAGSSGSEVTFSELAVVKTGEGTVVSSSAQINCGTTCSVRLGTGSSVTLTATPSTNSRFSGWSGACTGTDLSCTVVMRANQSVTATFVLLTFPLTVTVTPELGTVVDAAGKINCGMTCSATLDVSTSVTLTASAGTNNAFTGWSGGSCTGTALSCTFVMSSDRSVTATFAVRTFPLTVTTGPGIGTVIDAAGKINCGVTCSASFNMGTQVTLAVSAAPNNQFEKWAGACTGTSTSCVVTIDAIKSVTAFFTTNLITFNQPKEFESTVLALLSATNNSGDLYVGGSFTTYNSPSVGSNFLIRLNSNGTNDAGFAIGSGFNALVRVLAQATDGSGDIYVGGTFSSYNGTASKSIIRLHTNGTVATEFAVGTGFGSDVFALLPAADNSGDIYVGGAFTSYNKTLSNRIVRLNGDGTIDSSFNIGTGFDSEVRALALATDGSGDLYVGGVFTSYNGTSANRIVRLNANGTIDSDFNIGVGFDNTVLALAIDKFGDLYAGGAFSMYQGGSSNHIIRLNDNGTRDTAFVVGAGFSSEVRTLLPASDGPTLYAGGTFTSYKGTGSNKIIRLNTDGTLNSSFMVGSGFGTTPGEDIFALAATTDGSNDLYAGGTFLLYKGTTSVERIVRIASDGAVR